MAIIKCKECGYEVSDKATACPNCGYPIENEIVCKECGSKLNPNDRICTYCGCPVSNSIVMAGIDVLDGNSLAKDQTPPKPNNAGGTSLVNHLNNYVGNERPADLNWRVLFSDVSKKHTTEEAEEIFIVGTRKTTPSIHDVSIDWPHPWLYSRVFMMFIMAFALLWVCCRMFQNPNALPGLIVIGSFTVPLTTLILFLELNAWRNVSFFEVIKIFFVGGCASLVATLILFSILGAHELDIFGAFMTGFIEETGKAVIVFYFLNKLNKFSILNGLLIGAAVGAGFAAFESAGYAMRFFFQSGWEVMMDVIFLRGFLAPGGHVVWAAISGVGLVIAAKARNEISVNLFCDVKFLRLFIIPVILHGIWDSPLTAFGSEIYLVPIGLTVLAWIVVLILINMGLTEVLKIQSEC